MDFYEVEYGAIDDSVAVVESYHTWNLLGCFR